jgi:hypothetical protein
MAIRPSVKKQGSRVAVSVAEREQLPRGELMYNLFPLQEQYTSPLPHLFPSTIRNFNYDDYGKDFMI